MRKIPEITCIGEVLVDFISTRNGVGLSESLGFKKFAGGAAANVATGIAKLGVRSAFVGKVGNDPFGMFLCQELTRCGVDTSGIVTDDRYKTRLAFVSLTKSGERDFEFREQHPADEQLQRSEIDVVKLGKSKIIHISSFLLLNEPSRSTALYIAERFHKRGCIISFDPNLRLSLWKSMPEARRIHLAMVKRAAILRLNEEEALFLTGKRRLDSAVEQLRSLGPSVVVVTMGKNGCYAVSNTGSTVVRGFPVNVVDTTGCGDGFLAGLLTGMVKTSSRPNEISLETLYSICRYANAVGALTAARRGVISALPTASQIQRFLSTR